MPTGQNFKKDQGPLFSEGTSFFDGSNAANRSSLIQLQQNPSAPSHAALDSASGLILPDKGPQHRTDHFPEDSYDLSPSSHLMRFLGVLLGDAGVGQLRKRLGVAQFQSALTSSHFFDLDNFYGAIFNLYRTVEEDVAAEFNPYLDAATSDEWDGYHSADASFRERVIALARAIAMGATRPGLLAAAEAVVNSECDLYEGFTLVDALGDTTIYPVIDAGGDGDFLGDGSGGITVVTPRLWSNMETDFAAGWNHAEAFTWIGLEVEGAAETGGPSGTSGGPETHVLFRHWSEVEAIGTYATIEAHPYTWNQLETLDGSGIGSSGGLGTVNGFIAGTGPFAGLTSSSLLVRPKKHYDLLFPDGLAAAEARAEDAQAIYEVLDVLKPAGVTVTVDSNGIPIYTEVGYGSVAADSEYWEVVAEVRPRGTLNSALVNSLYPLSPQQAGSVSPYSGQITRSSDPHPLPRYAFSSFQGNEWSYASEVVSVVSYVEDDNGDVVEGNTSEYVTYYDGTTVNYSADKGIADSVQALAAKYAAGGIMSAAPYSDTRTPVTSIG